jgi:hypothetical protein
VIPGGASLGQEFAALQFTNSGKRTCGLVGFPDVTLLRKGTQVGQSSQPATGTSRRTLAPGAVAESKLYDYTQSCQAPLSDEIKVVVPGSTIIYARPQFQMRACVLRVTKLGPPE